MLVNEVQLENAAQNIAQYISIEKRSYQNTNQKVLEKIVAQYTVKVWLPKKESKCAS